jgi:hypothetical protein
MSSFYEPEAELVAQINAGISDDIPAVFHARMSRWPHPIMHNEWGTFGLFDDLMMTSERAFALIPTMIMLVLQQSEKEQCESSLALWSSLASMSDTTEMPLSLCESWPILERVITQCDCIDSVFWDAIKDWYRM